MGHRWLLSRRTHREDAIAHIEFPTRPALLIALAAIAACGSGSTTADPVTTAPDTVVPTSSADSTVATVLVESTVQSTVVASATDTTSPELPVGLAAWPTPSDPPPTLDELPRFLPADPIAGADDVVRFDWDADIRPDRIDHAQVFVTDDASAMLVVSTNPGEVAFTPEASRTYVEVPNWETAFFSRSAPGFAILTLVDSNGLVVLSGRRLSQEQVLVASGSMLRRPSGEPGWEFGDLPDGMFSIHEGWANGPVFREVDWMARGDLLAEVTIAGGEPMMIDPGFDLDNGASIVDVGGARAIAIERPGVGGPPTSLISWSPLPEIVVYFGMRAPLSEALPIAQGLHDVDLSTWESATHPLVDTPDGCSGFRC